MTNIVPVIPENAPFTPEQRNWLNGFLAGLYTGAPAAATQHASLKIAVLYATQSGTAEGLARKIAKELKAKGHIATVTSLEGYAPAALAEERYAILIASTYGNGDAPGTVQPFYERLCMEHFPRYQDLTYSVLALGDSHYEHFCKFGIDLDNKLAALGAVRLADRIDCDVDVAAPFAQWKAALLARIDTIASGTVNQGSNNGHLGTAKSPTPKTPERPHLHTRDNPLLAPLVERRALTRDVSSKLTAHLAFSTTGSQLHYEAGDACGVIPQNDPALIHDILNALQFTGNEMVHVEKRGTIKLLDALRHELVITRLNRKLIQNYATLGQCDPLLELLTAERQAQLDAYTSDRGLVDLLTEYPGVIASAADLVAMLPKLTPRLYSISSSPLAHAGQIHTTVAVVRYRTHNRERGGICSTHLADRVAMGDPIPIYIQPNKRFRLPAEMDAPIIMIGPGTGVAPFRAFLHERRALAASGRNWLFFGERSAATDFLYREEFESMLADGHLTRLDTAFSRDQEHKIYVQDKMLEQAAELWSWIEEGASIYVCGDASRMAKDVDAALHTIVAKQGSFDHEAAKEYVQNLKDEHRYHRDVY